MTSLEWHNLLIHDLKYGGKSLIRGDNCNCVKQLLIFFSDHQMSKGFVNTSTTKAMSQLLLCHRTSYVMIFFVFNEFS